MKTIITRMYSYKEVRRRGQPCSVLQEFDVQGIKVNYVPMPVEGCKLERIKANPPMYNTDLRWVKELSAYETLQLINDIGEPVRYYEKYYDNKNYAWIEIINKTDDVFSSF